MSAVEALGAALIQLLEAKLSHRGPATTVLAHLLVLEPRLQHIKFKFIRFYYY